MNTNKYGRLFPIQKIPLREKTEEWGQACVDAIIAREGSGSLNTTSIKIKLKQITIYIIVNLI